MNTTHNGVLLPTEMINATQAEKGEYAATVKRGNRSFINAVFALEDEAARLGIEVFDR